MDMFFVLRALQATADNMGDRPRNKRFQSSYCAKVGARAKEMDDPRWQVVSEDTFHACWDLKSCHKTHKLKTSLTCKVKN